MKMWIVVISALVTMLLALTGMVNAMTFYVPDDYPTISAAIDAASSGDTIIVRSGTYYENIIINKRLSLIGEGSPTIDAQYKRSAVEIIARNCVVKGFRCVNIPYREAGIKIESDGNTVENNTIEHSNIGILILNASGNKILNNRFKGGREGLRLQRSTENKIMNNIFRNCGLHIVASYNNEVDGNIVNGKPLVYLENESNAEIKYAGQVILVNCMGIIVRNCSISNTTVGIHLRKFSNCIIENNNLLENGWGGISLWGASKNKIVNNTCEGNDDSIHLCYSSENKVLNNKIIDNDFFGISLYLCSRNVISRNSICDNYFGIHLRHSPDNLIHLNDFVNNSVNIYSYNSDNIWNSTLTYVYRRKYKNHIGNCWSDYAGEDVNRDGIRNTFYKVDEDDYDYYPRIQPREFYFRKHEKSEDKIKNSTMETERVKKPQSPQPMALLPGAYPRIGKSEDIIKSSIAIEEVF